MTVKNALTNKIIRKRTELENMIENCCNLNDRNIIECSKELDKLIVQYHNWGDLSRHHLRAQ